MSGITLTPEQRQALRAAHRRFKDKRSADRIKCIYLVGCGWLQSDVCEALLLDAGTVRYNVQRYLESGIEGLLETHFTGGRPKLTDPEMMQLDQHLQEMLYLDAKSIVRYVQDTFRRPTASEASQSF